MGMLTRKQLTSLYRHMAAKRKEQDNEDAQASLVVAVRVIYDRPQPDGTYEILFMRNTAADKFQTPSGKSDIIPFAEGVILARQPGCSGGFHALNDARRFQRLNAYVQSLKLSPF